LQSLVSENRVHRGKVRVTVEYGDLCERGCSVGIIDVMNVVELASGGRMYILEPILMMNCLGIQVILGLLPQEFERLQYWHNWREGFVGYTAKMASVCIIHMPIFMTIISGIQVILRLLPHQFQTL
jgi:hypothetical protein